MLSLVLLLVVIGGCVSSLLRVSTHSFTGSNSFATHSLMCAPLMFMIPVISFMEIIIRLVSLKMR